MRTFFEILTTGVVNGSTYGLLGVTFGLIFWVTGRFHFAYGVIYALAAYLAVTFYQDGHLPVAVALVLGACGAGIAGGAVEVGVYRVLDRRSSGGGILGVFIASLGLVIAGEAALQLVWKGQPSYPFALLPLVPHHVGSADFTNLDILTVALMVVLIVAVDAVVCWTPFGRGLRAIESNRQLALLYGIKVKGSSLLVFVAMSAIGGVIGILYAARFAAIPTMGDNAVVYAFVVGFLARGRRPLVVGLAGIALGIVESTVGLVVSQTIQSMMVFLVLFVYVAAKPIASWAAGLRRLMVQAPIVAAHTEDVPSGV